MIYQAIKQSDDLKEEKSNNIDIGTQLYLDVNNYKFIT